MSSAPPRMGDVDVAAPGEQNLAGLRKRLHTTSVKEDTGGKKGEAADPQRPAGAEDEESESVTDSSLEVAGHATRGKLVLFKRPGFCQHCRRFIWGSRGVRCDGCAFALHDKCAKPWKVSDNGKASAAALPAETAGQCQHAVRGGKGLAEPTAEQLSDFTSKAFGNELSEYQLTRDDKSPAISRDLDLRHSSDAEKKERSGPEPSPSFGVFAPRNQHESKAMERALRGKLIAELRESKRVERHVFSFLDVAEVTVDAMRAIQQDGFTPCFESAKIKPWNFNVYLYPLWVMGVILRYGILFPLRLAVIVVGTLIGLLAMALTGACLREPIRSQVHLGILRALSNLWLLAWTAVVRYHGLTPTKRPNQVFVANHTTIFDIVILCSVRVFSIVGQKHPGIMGFFQDYLLSSVGLWFDRKDAGDRLTIFQSIRDYARSPTKNPLLLFPEGTCVNNEYCVMFKKGAFEIGATVHPIAIKYNKLFADPFYNSRKQSFARHLFNYLTSWAVVAEVWFLEPQTQQPGESVIDFSNRVKAMIAKKAGLKNVPWDGYLKYFKPNKKFVEERQRIFASSLLARYSQANLVDLEQHFLDGEQKSGRDELRNTTGSLKWTH